METKTAFPIIKEGFTNKRGKYFPNVREIAYKKDGFFGNLGKFVAETKREKDDFFSDEDDGVYIYQSHTRDDIAYRIYKKFADYNFDGYNDDELISELLKHQEKIELTDFPTGVVTRGGFIVGQEIKYYSDSITLFDYSKSEISKKQKGVLPTNLYLKVLKALEEMCKNNIFYLDGHPKNFVLKKKEQAKNVDDVLLNNYEVKTIDFEHRLMGINSSNTYHKNEILSNFKKMVMILNENFGIEDITGEFIDCESIDELEEQVIDMEKRLVKSKYYGMIR